MENRSFCFKKKYSLQTVEKLLKIVRVDRESLASLMESLGFSDDKIHVTELCLEELFTNALQHGNKGNPESEIAVGYNLERKGQGEYSLLCSVTDQGTGFDPDSVPDPTSDENLEKITGRGLLLVRRYADRVYFNGNKVGFEIYWNGEAGL